ncbi:N-acylneuraminate cytidylyltransferase [Formivibrio citricus]|uniref:N-acylneuraminate cytidylyltransferase n=1 Tax=Formivibrio citricus TaxID=83765 RepID=A0A1I4VB04_9NEIS|nr:pseudaminic acid cytidylyltransferase [Formivibrio citricus]SFM98337.1 N-acylneuraminate cytidylyltransferase [Formivibrio citricus]
MKVAIIPARGGSKRIPRKNIKPFLGKPMIAYSIGAAKESGVFDRIMVSTDDPEIAEVARAAGADVPFMRPEILSDDHAITVDVIRHAVLWCLDNGIPVEYACCIYATAPMVQARYVRQGLEILQSKADADYAFTVTSFPFPIQRAIRIRPDGGVEALHPEFRNTRSQDLEEAFHDAGQFYWGRTRAWLDRAPFFAPASLPIILPRHLVQDIDTEEDWRRAELLFQAWKAGGAA